MRRRDWLLTFAALPAPAAAPVSIQPDRLFPGAPLLLTAAGPLAATWLGRPLRLDRDAETGRPVALAAVGLDVKPGAHELRLADGRTVEILIEPHAYPTRRLRVAPKFVRPPKAVEKRIAEEREVKKRAFAARGPRLWAGSFAAPTDTAQTAGFGSRRTYNGKMQGIHQGLDFRAAPGTPVKAANHGRVAIARKLYYEGGCVALDHGDGLFSLYMHLSAFSVREGDRVERGQEVGRSGATGRVTGPHLHFGVQWQGLYLEPAALLRLRFG
jgi:murein DD-endopeptidase MepM/ murein hydrolase activator NlpD